MQYDLIIVGGGMVGASLACALRESQLKIALVDATPINFQNDPRLIALNYASYCLFENLHIWPTLKANAEPIHQVHVSDRGHFGKLRLNAEEMGLAALGYVVPAKFINAALDYALQDAKNIKHFRPTKLKTLTQNDASVVVTLQSDVQEIILESRYVVGADGTYSTVREQLGIACETEDCQQSAIVTITELQRPHGNIAYERFHPGGAIAMLPLTEERCATIWTDDNKIIQELLQLDDVTFLETLQKQFGYRLGRLKKTGQRHTFNLHKIKTEQILKKNVILIGNAAHTLHPIAAQGLNLALAEIAMLAQIILAKPTNPEWQNYLAWQQQQQTTSTRLSHELPWLFSKDFSLLNLARQLGLLGLDICPPLKKRFAWLAMGKKSQLPNLLKQPEYLM